jgi:hypothetical protein
MFSCSTPYHLSCHRDVAALAQSRHLPKNWSKPPSARLLSTPDRAADLVKRTPLQNQHEPRWQTIFTRWPRRPALTSKKHIPNQPRVISSGSHARSGDDKECTLRPRHGLDLRPRPIPRRSKTREQSAPYCHYLQLWCRCDL